MTIKCLRLKSMTYFFWTVGVNHSERGDGIEPGLGLCVENEALGLGRERRVFFLSPSHRGTFRTAPVAARKSYFGRRDREAWYHTYPTGAGVTICHIPEVSTGVASQTTSRENIGPTPGLMGKSQLHLRADEWRHARCEIPETGIHWRAGVWAGNGSYKSNNKKTSLYSTFSRRRRLMTFLTVASKREGGGCTLADTVLTIGWRSRRKQTRSHENEISMNVQSRGTIVQKYGPESGPAVARTSNLKDTISTMLDPWAKPIRP